MTAFACMRLFDEETLTLDSNGEARPVKTVRILNWFDTQYVRVTYAGVLPEYTSLQVGVEYSRDGGETWDQLVELGPALESGTVGPIVSNFTDIGVFMGGADDVLIRAFISGPADTTVTLHYIELFFR